MCHRYDRREVFRLAAGVGALAVGTATASNVARGQDQTTFEQMRGQAYKAWEACLRGEPRWADCERLMVEASRYGQLGESELRLVSYLRRGFLDRAPDSLPVAQMAYARYPCASSAAELAESLADNYEFAKGRSLLARHIGAGTSAASDATLRVVRTWLAGLASDGERALARSAIQRLAAKRYEVVFTLATDYLRPQIREEYKRLSYREFAVYPDNAVQRTTFEVTGADKVETYTDAGGNRRLRIWAPDSVSPTVRLAATITGAAYDLWKSEPQSRSIPEAMKPYLGKTALIDPTGPVASALAGRLKGGTRLQSLTNLQAWWEGIEYATPRTSASGASEVMLRERRGHCGECSRGETAVLRAMGIPARRILTLAIQEPGYRELTAQPTLGGHALTELYDPTHGWIQWDARLTARDPQKPQGPMLETDHTCIRMVAEDPTSTDLSPESTDGNWYFYGWKDERADPPDMRNSAIRLVGLGFGELPPITSA